MVGLMMDVTTALKVFTSKVKSTCVIMDVKMIGHAQGIMCCRICLNVCNIL